MPEELPPFIEAVQTGDCGEVTLKRTEGKQMSDGRKGRLVPANLDTTPRPRRGFFARLRPPPQVARECETCGVVIQGEEHAVLAGIELHRQREHRGGPLPDAPGVCRVCGAECGHLSEVDLGNGLQLLGNGLLLRICPDCRETGPRGCLQAMVSEAIDQLQIAYGLANLTDDWAREDA